MKLSITGGGTGGHVYPALEVGQRAAALGAELHYIGSRRGMEGDACRRLGIPFDAVDAETLGARNALTNLRGIFQARRVLQRVRPDALFSTGGYSSGPAVMAARILRIPYVIHAADSVPGRANRLFGPRAYRFLYTFRRTADVVSYPHAERTGQPIRQALREAAARPEPGGALLVAGGSQGAQAVNEVVIDAIRLLGDAAPPVIHAAGPKLYDAAATRAQGLDRYRLVPYLDAAAMSEAYRTASLFIGRSGGAIAESAAFRLPSILVPLPISADHHQFWNAMEFRSMNASDVLWQPSDRAVCPAPDIPRLDPQTLAQSIQNWMQDEHRVAEARQNLCDWDIPNATQRIVEHVFAAGAR